MPTTRFARRAEVFSCGIAFVLGKCGNGVPYGAPPPKPRRSGGTRANDSICRLSALPQKNFFSCSSASDFTSLRTCPRRFRSRPSAGVLNERRHSFPDVQQHGPGAIGFCCVQEVFSFTRCPGRDFHFVYFGYIFWPRIRPTSIVCRRLVLRFSFCRPPAFDHIKKNFQTIEISK